MNTPILLVVAMAVGCAPIKSEVSVVEYPEGTRHMKRAVKGSRTYDAEVQVDGTNLVITLASKEMCEEADVPIVRRKRVTTKTEIPGKFGIAGEYLAGGAGIVLGGLIVANPERACTSTDGSGNTTMNDPQDCVTLGWGIVAAGAIVVGIAAIDSIRVADEEVDLGTREGAYEAEARECHAGPVGDKNVELQLGKGELALQGKTSEGGEVTFALLDAWDDILPTPGTPGKLIVGDETVQLSITDKQSKDLATALYDNLHSRVARDASEETQKRCDAAVAAAQQQPVRADSADVAVADARESWQRAKAKCGLLWNADDQSRRDAAEKAIGENRVGAVVLALNAGNLDRVDELLNADKGLAALLHDDPGVIQLLRKIVGEPTRAMTAGGKDVADSQRRLCRARRLFVTIRGAEKWNQFKLEVAQNVSELGGGVPSNIVRLMDAAPCD